MCNTRAKIRIDSCCQVGNRQKKTKNVTVNTNPTINRKHTEKIKNSDPQHCKRAQIAFNVMVKVKDAIEIAKINKKSLETFS
jgi:hypothetical protein